MFFQHVFINFKFLRIILNFCWIVRMFYQLHSPLTTVKLYLVPETKPSNCGTQLLNVNTLFKMKGIPIGCLVYVFHQTTAIQLLYHAVGIVPSKSGTWQTASWRSTTRVTMDIWTLLPCLQMVHYAHQVVKTLRRSYGTWMMASTCTHWTTMTSSMHCAFHLIDIGCALPMDHPSRFG